jgi:hypothetical protein
VGCRASLMVAASGEGEGEEQREVAKTHRLQTIVALAGFCLKKIWRGGSLFLLGPAEFRCFVVVF